jgi:hypothetical protein
LILATLILAIQRYQALVRSKPSLMVGKLPREVRMVTYGKSHSVRRTFFSKNLRGASLSVNSRSQMILPSHNNFFVSTTKMILKLLMQIASFIKTHIFSRRRPIDGWKYMIEEIGPNARKGKGSVQRLPSVTDPATQPFREESPAIASSGSSFRVNRHDDSPAAASGSSFRGNRHDDSSAAASSGSSFRGNRHY